MNIDAIPTENFTRWLIKIRKALRDNSGMDVPCGECRACCTSAYFIHIHPHEREALAAIPGELLSDAPGTHPGTRRLRFNKRGECALLQKDKCTVYENRPWTCRIYDCRLLTAAGLVESDDMKEINGRAKRWQFTFSDESDNENFQAVKKAACFIVSHMKDFPPGYVSERPVQQAVVAVKVFELFKATSLEKAEESMEAFIATVINSVKKFNA